MKKKKFLFSLLVALSSGVALIAQSDDKLNISTVSPLMMFAGGDEATVKPLSAEAIDVRMNPRLNNNEASSEALQQQRGIFRGMSEGENGDSASTESDDINGGLMELTPSTSSSSARLAARSSSATTEREALPALPTGHDNEHRLTDVTGTSSARALADLKKAAGEKAKASLTATSDVLTDEDLDNPAGINIPGIPERLVYAWVETRHDLDCTQANTIFEKIFSVAKRNHEISLNPEDLDQLRKRLENRLDHIAQEETQKVPYDRDAYFATHSITVENNHRIKTAASSAASASSAVGIMNGHDIEVLPNAQPQYMRIFEPRMERALTALKEHAEETARQLSMFRNIDPGIDGSKRLALDDEGTLFVQPAAATTDQEKETNRKVATHFFDACKKFYGETLLNDLYPAAEREKLLAKGEPLTVATVRSILTKSDKVVSEVTAYFKELPHLDPNVAEHVVLAKQAQEDLDKALAAYQELGEPTQHLGEAVMHSMTVAGAAIVGNIIPLSTLPGLSLLSGVFFAEKFLFNWLVKYNEPEATVSQEVTPAALISQNINQTASMIHSLEGLSYISTGSIPYFGLLDGMLHGPSASGVVHGFISGAAITSAFWAGLFLPIIAADVAFPFACRASTEISKFSTVLSAKEPARATLIKAQKKTAMAHARAIATTQQAAQQAVDAAYEMPEEQVQLDPESGVLSFALETEAALASMRDNMDALADARLAAQQNAKQPKIKKLKSIMPLKPWQHF